MGAAGALVFADKPAKQVVPDIEDRFSPSQEVAVVAVALDKRVFRVVFSGNRRPNQTKTKKRIYSDLVEISEKGKSGRNLHPSDGDICNQGRGVLGCSWFLVVHC